MNDKPIWIDYTNHRGERRWRHIEPRRIYWGSTEWHPQPQWLLHAFDVEKVHDRDFALAGIHEWSDQPPDMHAAPLSNDAIDAIADSIMEPLDSGDAAQDEMERVLMRRFARACIRAASAPAGVHAEPAGDAGMPVVAHEAPDDEQPRVVTEHSMAIARKDGGASLSSMRPYCNALVRQRDAQAAIAARDAEVAALRERVQFHVAMTRDAQEIAAAAQNRVRELDAALNAWVAAAAETGNWLPGSDGLPRATASSKSGAAGLYRLLDIAAHHFSEGTYGWPDRSTQDALIAHWRAGGEPTADARTAKHHEPTTTPEDRVRMGWSDSDGVAAEYAETYARAQAQAAFWVWHALTHWRDPDMVPEEFLRPSGRITWLRDTDATKPGELMTPAELEEAYAASAAEMPQLDHNWRTGQPADPPEIIDSMMRRKLAPQKLEWDDSSDAATGAGDR